jgi:hypothetical protein
MPVQALAGGTPLDVVVAVDTSGSMDLEVAEVEGGLNHFANALHARGYDPRLVAIAAASDLCVPAPLGSGACPADENLPGYRHVTFAISSNDALQQILNLYPNYQASLRAGALRWILVVSDDDSDLSAASFGSQLVPLDAAFAGYRFHAIAASVAPSLIVPDACNTGEFPPLPLAAAEGAVYKQLVAQTGGVFYDLCLQDFDPAWPKIAALDTSLFRDGFESP